MSYICLDIGNVLLDCDFSGFFTTMQNRNVAQPHVWEFMERVQPHQDVGHVSLEREMKIHFDMHDVSEHMDSWRDCLKRNEMSLGQLTVMLDAGVNVALLSNMGAEHHALLSHLFGGLYERCTQFISCEVGARKPSKIYYQSFLTAHPDFRGCVYVDDRMENLGAGNKMGFNSQHLDTSKMSPETLGMRWAEIKHLVDPDKVW
jgi:FMN phosphatase YigB (HAD superfamily)